MSTRERLLWSLLGEAEKKEASLAGIAPSNASTSTTIPTSATKGGGLTNKNTRGKKPQSQMKTACHELVSAVKRARVFLKKRWKEAGKEESKIKELQSVNVRAVAAFAIAKQLEADKKKFLKRKLAREEEKKKRKGSSSSSASDEDEEEEEENDGQNSEDDEEEDVQKKKKNNNSDEEEEDESDNESDNDDENEEEESNDDNHHNGKSKSRQSADDADDFPDFDFEKYFHLSPPSSLSSTENKLISMATVTKMLAAVFEVYQRKVKRERSKARKIREEELFKERRKKWIERKKQRKAVRREKGDFNFDGDLTIDDDDDMEMDMLKKNRPGQRKRREKAIRKYGTKADFIQQGAALPSRRALELVGDNEKAQASVAKFKEREEKKNPHREAQRQKTHAIKEKGLAEPGMVGGIIPSELRKPVSRGEGGAGGGGKKERKSGGGGGAVGGGDSKKAKKDEVVHPSWEAKRAEKEMLAKAASLAQTTARTHVKFDNDD